MCGITGIVNHKEKVLNPIAITDMSDELKHRGPDSRGTYISPEGRVVFGHRRLSLVGLDKKATIMSIPKKADGHFEVAIVFNGEIYNFRELKKYFQKRGYISVSPSDFEVIVFAWQEWGVKCVDHLTGEFAFVLYDEESKEIFMARDRTGVKPLFYGWTKNKEFVFGSEPKAILRYPDIDKTIDYASVAEFLLMGHTFAAGNQSERASYYRNIHQLPPAHRALVDEKGVHLTRYYDLPIGRENKGDNKKTIKKLLTQSVEDRLPDEVPTSIGLSGGLDSSIIAALAKRSKKAKKLLASCVSYMGDPNEDYKHAKILAKKDKIKLVGPVISSKEMMATIDECIWSLDGPVDSIRRMGMHANYKKIHDEGYRATLIGEGADEFNLGYYHKFPGLKLDKEYCKSAKSLKKMFRLRAEYVERFFTKEFLRKISFDQIIDAIIKENYERCPSSDPIKRMQYFYAKRFLQYLEDGNDRASMSHSVEARLPFVDPDLIKASLAVPQEQNIVNGNEKNILREAFKDILPKEIYKRVKMPFPANESMEFHKMLSLEFAKEIKNADRGVWSVLSKKFVSQMSLNFQKRIVELEKQYGKNKGGGFLTAWLPIGQSVTIRTNQVFSVLTLIRWLGEVL
ncbi:asparagine synthase (glutamine-hydrolyzing) [Candidatus Microgenomates bacterium]|nr:asparagine synthase (glutamine-hydrolyzing) [Candidatus Microgenomates bacterium]